MIKFSGILSEECKTEIVTRRARKAKKGLIIMLGPIILLSFWLCFVIKSSTFYIMTLAFFGSFLYALYRLSRAPKNIVAQRPMQKSVAIDDMYITDELTRVKTKIEAVKNVIKTEHCYYICCGKLHDEIECPRETLVEGTEEEFEMLFQGKIISVL